MIRLFPVCSLVATAAVATATPLPFPTITPSPDGARTWNIPGNPAFALPPGANAETRGDIPELTEREQGARRGTWHAVLSLDLFGTTNGEHGEVTLEAFDPADGRVIAATTASTSGVTTPAAVTIIRSSEQPGNPASNAFDGNPATMWHSSYQGEPQQPPHWIGLEFGKPREFTTLTYHPRGGGGNGTARAYRLEIRTPDAANWESVAAGEVPGRQRRDPLVITLDEPITIDAFRFVIESDHGGGFGSASQIEIPDLEFPEEKPVVASQRAWLEIPAEDLSKLTGKPLGLRATHASGSSVVIGQPQLARLHSAPTPRLFGRSNGGLGPDKLGAGLLGFDAMTEHEQYILTVMTVRDDSAAAAAGLRPGDAIIAVDGSPLARNDVAPGWWWFEHSHEARLGRAAETALADGRADLPVTILRDGKPEEIRIPLKRENPLANMIPSEDPETARMLADLIAFLERTQRDDGSWSNCGIRTTFSALALMATADDQHLPRVARAIDWAMQRYPEPENYGNLGFWAGGFIGKLYAEWHLATGDRRVAPYMIALQEWAHAGHHPSSWDVPALGHGTNDLPYDRKALVAPACHLLIAEALGMKAGMQSKIWELLAPYMELAWSNPEDGGNGTLGYNPSHKDLQEFWARSGMFAMVCHLRDDRGDMRDSMVAIMRERHPWLRNSHAYGEPGGALGLLGLNLAAPDVYREIIAQYSWWFSLAWEPGYGLRFTTPHMGAPYMGEDDLINAAYALVLQGPARTLHMTGAAEPGMWRDAYTAHSEASASE
jgi:hypothetical protein